MCQSTGYTPFQLLYGVPKRDIIDVCLPKIPENTARNYFAENIDRIRNYAVDNIKCAKESQKMHYDKRSRPHTFAVGDKVYLKIQRRKLNEDTKLRNQYCGPYFIDKFTSPTNVTLRNKTGKELPRSALINNLKKCQIRKQFKIPENNISSKSNSPSLSSRDSGTDDEYVYSSDDVVSTNFSDSDDDKSFNYEDCSNSASSDTHGSDIAVDGVDCC